MGRDCWCNDREEDRVIEGVAGVRREVCDKDDQWALRERDGVSRGCEEDGRSEGTNKTDEIAHRCFGQIMFDTADPCLVWLIARYMRFFVTSTAVAAGE